SSDLVRPVLVLLAGLAACAPTHQPAPSTQAAQWEARFRAEREARERAERENAERERAAREAREREESARAWTSFYDRNPILRGREKCVSRALNTLTDKTW